MRKQRVRLNYVVRFHDTGRAWSLIFAGYTCNAWWVLPFRVFLMEHTLDALNSINKSYLRLWILAATTEGAGPADKKRPNSAQA